MLSAYGARQGVCSTISGARSDCRNPLCPPCVTRDPRLWPCQGSSSSRPPLGSNHRVAHAASAKAVPEDTNVSQIIADVLNEERQERSQRPSPAGAVLQALDQQGLGVRTVVTREFSTQHAGIMLEAFWEDDTTGDARDGARRMAVLAVYQEWLVARSRLVGQAVDMVQRLRPGYLPSEAFEQLRRAREAKQLCPETETLDANALLQLAVLLQPAEQLLRQVDELIIQTFQQVTQLPSYRGRPDLLPPLRRGLAALRASVAATLRMAHFRVLHLPEASALQAELRRRRQARRVRRDELTNGYQGLWVRAPEQPQPQEDASTRSINDRLYKGQLQPMTARWIPAAERIAAELDPARAPAPRGLRLGRVGQAAFRPLPGAALYGYAGCTGGSGFASAERLQFNELHTALLDQLALTSRAQVPAAALTTFSRLQRTALLDLVSSWVLEADPQLARTMYPSTCKHAASLRSRAPLQVSRRTAILVQPSKELDTLRQLARQRGPEVLTVVHPLARKQATQKGEWQYWLEAHRLWNRFVAMPNKMRAATLTLTLPAGSSAAGGVGDAGQKQFAASPGGAGGSGRAVNPAVDSLTSFSSMDDDDSPAAAVSAAGSAGATDGTAVEPADGASTSSAAAEAGSVTAQQVAIKLPPGDVQQLLSALLDLVPGHISSSAAGSASSSTPGHTDRAAADRAASQRRSSEWLPATSSTMQVRCSPPLRVASASIAPGGQAAALNSLGAGTSTAAGDLDDTEPSWFEMRWAQGCMPAAAPTASSSGSSNNGGHWCEPYRLSQVQLLSLINVLSDVVQQCPQALELPSSPLRVPTLSAFDRALSAVRALVSGAFKVVGLCALLAVPLAGVVKAGHLNQFSALAQAGLPRGAQAAWVTDSAASTSCRGATASTASSSSTSSSSGPMAGQLPAAAQPSASELVRLCTGLEEQLLGKVWLEVTATPAAQLTPADGRRADSSSGVEEASTEASQQQQRHPEFQVLLDSHGAVLGCAPVNPAASALYQRLPLAALLRDEDMQAALAKHLEAVRKGKAAPDAFSVPYQPARHRPLGKEQGSVAVLKLQLQPSQEAAAHVTHGKGRGTREFALADAMARPWYDSDSLLWWIQSGVALPSLEQELRSGLLAHEDQQRADFLAAAAAAGVAHRVEGESLLSPAARSRALQARSGADQPSSNDEAVRAAVGGGAGEGGASGAVVQPEQLSEQQLQEAMQQLFRSLGIAGDGLKVTGSGVGGASSVQGSTAGTT